MQGDSAPTVDLPAKCEYLQLQWLASSNPRKLEYPSPATLCVHGVEATGKSLAITTVLDALKLPSAVVRSPECITTRHLLERTISAVRAALENYGMSGESQTVDGRCDSISAFVVNLQRLLEGAARFVLVFDGIDRQREAAPTLLPALARLGEIVSPPKKPSVRPIDSPRSPTSPSSSSLLSLNLVRSTMPPSLISISHPTPARKSSP